MVAWGVDIKPNNQQENDEEIHEKVTKFLPPGLLLR